MNLRLEVTRRDDGRTEGIQVFPITKDAESGHSAVEDTAACLIKISEGRCRKCSICQLVFGFVPIGHTTDTIDKEFGIYVSRRSTSDLARR